MLRVDPDYHTDTSTDKVLLYGCRKSPRPHAPDGKLGVVDL